MEYFRYLAPRLEQFGAAVKRLLLNLEVQTRPAVGVRSMSLYGVPVWARPGRTIRLGVTTVRTARRTQWSIQWRFAPLCQSTTVSSWRRSEVMTLVTAMMREGAEVSEAVLFCDAVMQAKEVGENEHELRASHTLTAAG